jgi:hypothetical protein
LRFCSALAVAPFTVSGFVAFFPPDDPDVSDFGAIPDFFVTFRSTSLGACFVFSIG